MAVTSTRIINITFSGLGFNDNDSFPAASNASSPGSTQYIDLASGANTITPPTGATACTILPPAGNSTSITLKGVTGDTGVRLHNTDPASISLNSTGTFCLTAGGTINGVRLVWS